MASMKLYNTCYVTLSVICASSVIYMMLPILLPGHQHILLNNPHHVINYYRSNQHNHICKNENCVQLTNETYPNWANQLRFRNKEDHFLEIKKVCSVKPDNAPTSTFRCNNLNYNCQSDVTFFTKLEILEGLRGKWMFLMGDSTTRAMTLALIEQLDETQTHPHNLQTWYNVTDLQSDGQSTDDILGDHWRGRAGDFRRLDYIFRCERSGTWRIAYKKVCIAPWVKEPSTNNNNSTVTSWTSVTSVLADLEDDVFFPGIKTLSSDEVRISFYMCKGTHDVHKAWEKKIHGNPDIVYVNVGAWGFKYGCDLDVLRAIQSSTSQFIWGTIQKTKYSRCDQKLTGLDRQDISQLKCVLGTRARLKWRTALNVSDVLIVDRSVLPRTPLGKSMKLNGVHYTHLVNLYDVMQMFKVLGWKQQRDLMSVWFSPFCAVNAKSIDDLKKTYNVSVPLPDQGWKSTWKLPCRYTVT